MSCDLYFDSDNVFDCGHHDCDGCCDFHKKDNGSSEMQKVIKIAEINFWPKKISTKNGPKMTQNGPKISTS